jgi:serine-type D-Ala-D-Ala carboxypeptidase (penicillin-binding protein 5/6)
MGRKRFKVRRGLFLALSLATCLTLESKAVRAQPFESREKQFPPVAVKAAILLDLDSGQVLLSKEKDRRFPPASLTKVMTALIALESGSLQDAVTIDAESAAQPQPRIGLRPGDRLRLRDLLAALLITSANDACRAVALHLDKGLEGFVARMNQRASALGLGNTRFTNPCGFDDSGHYSTAADLAVLSREALKDNRFAMIVRTAETKIQTADGKRNFALRNTNRLLSDPEINGVKTGFTKEAGHCLIVTAFKERRHLLLVGLDFRDRWLGPMELILAGLYGAGPSSARRSP